MNWFFQDSRGVQGPMAEVELREILKTDFEQSAVVRQGESSWIAAEIVRTKFAKLDHEGVYLRSDDKIFGPFVARRADELRSQHAGRFDSFKIGKEGKWLAIDKLGKEEFATAESPPLLPSHAIASANPSPMSVKDAFSPLVSLAKQPVDRIANNPRNQEVVGEANEQIQNKMTDTLSSLTAIPVLPVLKPNEKKKIRSQKMVVMGCGGCLVAPCLLTVVVMVFGLIIEAVAPEFVAESRAIDRAKEEVERSSISLENLTPKNHLGQHIDPWSGKLRFIDEKTRVERVRNDSGKLIGFNVHLSYTYIRSGYDGGSDLFVDLEGNVASEKSR